MRLASTTPTVIIIIYKSIHELYSKSLILVHNTSLPLITVYIYTMRGNPMNIIKITIIISGY